MSYYVYGGKMSYQDYLAARGFTCPTTTAIRGTGRQITLDVPRQTLAVIASSEGLIRDQIHTLESTEPRTAGTAASESVTLSYHFDDSPSGLEDLDARFHWGFCRIMALIGRMNDSLSDLKKPATTSAEIAAYEQYEIARSAFRRELYIESLESLHRAIDGDRSSPGYRLEWRFYQMKGVLELGFVGGDMTLMDTSAAEKSFLQAARYARTDLPAYAGYAWLCAGWAAYGQGKFMDALAHTQQAVALNPHLGEGFFQAAKIHAALGQVDQAFAHLGQAIDMSRFFALKAAGDGDFGKTEDRLRNYLDGLRRKKYQQALSAANTTVRRIEGMTDYLTDVRRNKALSMLKRFFSEGERWALMDLLNIQGLVDMVEGMLSEVRVPAESRSSLSDPHPSDDSARTLVPGQDTRPPPGKAGLESLTKSAPVKTSPATPPKVGASDRDGHRDAPARDVREVIEGIQWCSIAPGTFTMGHGDFKHRTTISRGYLIGKYPVTQSQWEAVMGNNPSHFKGADHPVETVSWEDCRQFIERINTLAEGKHFRLPTEAEWEYACRAGSTTLYIFGNDERLLDDYAWYYKNAGNKTHPVGRKKPNAWSLYDMLGNVWEWCQDWYNDYPIDDVTDPAGPSSGISRVIRGGSWNNLAKYCRADNRNYLHPNEKLNRLGLRLVRHIL